VEKKYRLYKLKGEELRSSRRNYPFSSGFTLVEVMIALFILSVIFSIVYSSFFPTRKVIKNIEERRGEWQMLESGLQIMSSDIRTAALPPSNALSLFKGNDAYTSQQPLITFSSYTPYQSDGIGRLRVVAYNIEESLDTSGTLSVRRLLYDNTEEIIEDEILMDGLNEIKLSYFDGEEWKEQWETESSSNLPKGIKVILSFKRGEVTSIIPIEGS
jgi:type II secretion system protein J